MVTMLCVFLLLPVIVLHVAESSHSFVVHPEPFVAPLGDEVSFECTVRMQAEQFWWKHNGVRIPNSNTTKSKTSRHVVKFENTSQVGDYQCVATFGVLALTSNPARLSLAELHQFSEQPDQIFEVTTGNTVTLHCDPPYSKPPAVIKFMKDGRELPENVPVLSTTNALVLYKVDRYNAGNYTCRADNWITGQKVVSQHKMVLKVKEYGSPTPPFFLTPVKTDYTTHANDKNISMECGAVGHPPPNITWSKFGGELPEGRLLKEPGALILTRVERQDEGTYTCLAKNGIGNELRSIIKLHFREPPSILTELKSPTVQEGSDTVFECKVSGVPMPQVSWVFNGESVENDPHFKIAGTKLFVEQAEKRHAGMVQCFATNVLGTKSSMAILKVTPKQVTAEPHEGDGQTDETLIIYGNGNDNFKGQNTGKVKNGKPNVKHSSILMVPPTRPNITRLSDKSVMVRWSVPPNDGLPIQFFKVQYRELGNRFGIRNSNKAEGSRWKTNNEDIPPHIRSYEVDNLKPNQIYKFRIAAAYSNDDNKLGPNSHKFLLEKDNNSVTLPAPRLVSVEAINATVIQISWNYPMFTSAIPVEGFFVSYRAASTAGSYANDWVAGASVRSFNISHLQPDTMYEIKMQSFTKRGASLYSSILTQKTLALPTESPAENELSTEPTPAVSNSTDNQMYIISGSAVVGVLLLLIACSVVYICKKKRKPSNDEKSDGEHQDKFTENSIQVESTKGRNGTKSRLNGRLPKNGKINITNNPLADNEEKKQNVMELSLLASQNNNREAGGSQYAETEEAVSSDEENEAETKSWRRSQSSQGEKYI